MAWIKIFPEHNSVSELTKVCKQIKDKRGKLPKNMLRDF
jgi:hypothetical protein